MMQTKISFHRKMKILITHLHGDHVLGLPGLLQTMALMDRKEPVQVYGPVGLKDFLVCTKETLNFGLTFPVEISEILAEGVVCDTEEYTIIAKKSNHAIESYAFAFEEKPRPGKFYPKKALALGVVAGELFSRLQRGEEITIADGKVIKSADVMGPMRAGRKIVYTGDTRPFEGFAKFAEGADLVIHDCTFDDSLTEKAALDGHSTPSSSGKSSEVSRGKTTCLIAYQCKVPKRWVAFGSSQKSIPQHPVG